MYPTHYKCDDKLKIYNDKIYSHYEPLNRSQNIRNKNNISKSNKSKINNISVNRVNVNKMIEEYMKTFNYLSKKHGLKIPNKKDQYLKDENYKEIEKNINNLVLSNPPFLDKEFLDKNLSDTVLKSSIDLNNIQLDNNKLRNSETFKDYDIRLTRIILAKKQDNTNDVNNEDINCKVENVNENSDENQRLKSGIKRLTSKEKIMLEQKNREGIIQEEKSHDDNDENEYDKEFKENSEKSKDNKDEKENEKIIKEPLPLLEEMIDKDYKGGLVDYNKYPLEYNNHNNQIEKEQNDEYKENEDKLTESKANTIGNNKEISEDLTLLEDKIKWKGENLEKEENKEEAFSDENHESFNNAKFDIENADDEEEDYNDFS